MVVNSVLVDRVRVAAADLHDSLAVQFHPELTPSMLRGWVANGGQAYLDHHGVDVADLLARTDREADQAVRRSHRLVDRFLDQVARVTPDEAVPARAGAAGSDDDS